MKQITYNGVVYNVYAKGEEQNPNPNYESIVNANTKKYPESENKIAVTFLNANGIRLNESNEKNTHNHIRKLLKVLDNSSAITTCNTNIDFLFTMEYIEKYAYKPYQRITDSMTPSTIEELNDIKNNGQKAVKEISKIAEVLSERFGLSSRGFFNKWLDGSNKKVRDYLWLQMQYEDYRTTTDSISIVVEKSVPNNPLRSKPRLRFSIEMQEDNATQVAYQTHHKFLERPLKSGLCYVITSNELNYVAIYNEDANTVKTKINNGIYKRAQLSKVIEYDPNLTNEQIYDEMIQGVSDLIPYYDYVVGKSNTKTGIINQQNLNLYSKGVEMMNNNIGLNTILYGPPGTGKTYNTKRYVVSICDNKSLDEVEKMDYKSEVIPRYNELLKEGRVMFTTFHQSYGYEEFIEGIKPVVDDDNNVIYNVVPGVFKQFCDDAKINSKELSSIGVDPNASIWKMSLYGGKTYIKKECYEDGYARIGFEKDAKDGSVNIFMNKMEIGDIILSLKSFYEIDGIGIIEGDVEELDNKSEFKLARKVKWLIKDKLMNIKEINGDRKLPIKTCSGLPNISRSGVMELITNNIEKKFNEDVKPYVFIIDEINRGNISKIFGELITLIETSKRLGNAESMESILPYSREKFGVPKNVYILGTMNTADRSISLMDTALRRRFDFVEMMPDSKILANLNVEGINIHEMLDVINERITVLYDREHTIGHAFFIELNDKSTISDLGQIFKNKIIPLLQEYFYEDYSKIRLVLGDNGKSDEKKQFVKEIDNTKKNIFKGNYDPDIAYNVSYELNDEALYDAESYIEIYK